jgi:hypothetical protein
MTIESIEKFLDNENIQEGQFLKIDFKKRNTIYGLIIRSRDYSDLKSKNFWRILPATAIQDWKKSQNIDLARIYSGTDFTKLSISKN